jgi:hypothetical protein
MDSATRVTSHVLHLLPLAHVAHHDLVAFDADPDERHLRAAVGVERGQVCIGPVAMSAEIESGMDIGYLRRRA